MSGDSRDIARSLEKYNLTKADLRAILSALKSRWRKNAKANAGYIAAATAIQGGLVLTPEHVVQKFWGDLVKAINYLLELNALHGDSDVSVEFFRDNLKAKIATGELFGEED